MRRSSTLRARTAKDPQGRRPVKYPVPAGPAAEGPPAARAAVMSCTSAVTCRGASPRGRQRQDAEPASAYRLQRPRQDLPSRRCQVARRGTAMPSAPAPRARSSPEAGWRWLAEGRFRTTAEAPAASRDSRSRLQECDASCAGTERRVRYPLAVGMRPSSILVQERLVDLDGDAGAAGNCLTRDTYSAAPAASDSVSSRRAPASDSARSPLCR